MYFVHKILSYNRFLNLTTYFYRCGNHHARLPPGPPHVQVHHQGQSRHADVILPPQLQHVAQRAAYRRSRPSHPDLLLLPTIPPTPSPTQTKSSATSHRIHPIASSVIVKIAYSPIPQQTTKRYSVSLRFGGGAVPPANVAVAAGGS